MMAVKVEVEVEVEARRWKAQQRLQEQRMLTYRDVELETVEEGLS
jgi:hypothetical protein